MRRNAASLSKTRQDHVASDTDSASLLGGQRVARLGSLHLRHDGARGVVIDRQQLLVALQMRPHLVFSRQSGKNSDINVILKYNL